jgi:hypothetical protein
MVCHSASMDRLARSRSRGVYHHVSEAHLHRYLAEFDFRYNNRSKLGIEDADRAAFAVRGAVGKRLTYRQPNPAAHA